MDKINVKTIDINAKQWFDRINGNSYFSGWVTINYAMPEEQRFKMDFQYGYGSSYVDNGFSVLKEVGLISEHDGRHWSYCKDNNIILRADIQEGCLKRDVIKYVE